MMRRLLIVGVLAVSLAACSAGAGTAPSHPTTLTDGAGRTVTLDLPVRRVVSLAPSNTEILFAIGAGQLLVGRDSYSDYPPEAKSVSDLGGMVGSLNTEIILAQRPDVVLISPLTAPEQIAELDKAGLRSYVVPNPKSFDELYANLKTIGMLTGHEQQAEALVASLQQRVKAVTDKVATVTTRPVVYYELDATDPNAPFTSGPDTFVDLLIRTAGGVNFGGSLKGDWVQISVEEILSKQPDLILLGDNLYGGVTPEMVKARPGWDALKAVQEGKVYPFDDNTVSRPGPRLVDGLEALARLLHPELFK